MERGVVTKGGFPDWAGGVDATLGGVVAEAVPGVKTSSSVEDKVPS